MDTLTATERFATLDQKMSVHDYNYQHFRTRHLLDEVQRMWARCGIAPGDLAPDFTLPRVGGGTLRLRDLRGTSVLLHFGSVT